MTSIFNAMQEFSKLGIFLSLDLFTGKDLKFKAPRGVMTETIKQQILHLKPDIVLYLQQRENTPNVMVKESKNLFEKKDHFSQYETDLPRPWQEASQRVLKRNKPLTLTQSKWDFILFQLHLWMEKDIKQFNEVIQNKWTLQEVFGCHKLSPQNRYDGMGLLLLLQSREITEITGERILLRTFSGATQTYYKKNSLTCSLDEKSTLYEIE